MELQKILADCGLTKSKGTIYVAALELGTATTHDIARRARLPRTTAHEILQSLAALGLVHHITKGRTRIYTAESPTKLKSLLKEQERKVDEALPTLLSLYHIAADRPAVKFYEGIAGVKTVFEDTLHARHKILSSILSMEDLYALPGKKFMDQYVQHRVAAGLKLRVIRSKIKEVEETWATSTREMRELHYAPAGLIFPMTIFMYDEKVALIGTKKENFGMIIASADLHTTLTNFFEVLWEVTKAGPRAD